MICLQGASQSSQINIQLHQAGLHMMMMMMNGDEIFCQLSHSQLAMGWGCVSLLLCCRHEPGVGQNA